jgi:hypothetical protein
VTLRARGDVAELRVQENRRRSTGTVLAWNAVVSREVGMALKQYEEEYVASLEASVHSLQKERRALQSKVQDLLAELEHDRPLKKDQPGQ